MSTAPSTSSLPELPATGAPTGTGEAGTAELYAALSRTLRWLRRTGNEGGPELTVGPGGLSALATLADTGPLRPGVLADREGVTASTTSRIVDTLVGHGLVRRTPDPADGRASLVGLTAAGDELVERVRNARIAALAARVGRLPSDQRALIRDATPALAALADPPGRSGG